MRQKSIYKDKNEELNKKKKGFVHWILFPFRHFTSILVIGMFCILGYVFILGGADDNSVLNSPKDGYVAIEKHYTPPTTKSYSTDFGLGTISWNPNQIMNIMTVYKAAKDVNHPNPKRMVAHLMNESSATTVKDGDIVNGAFKKSYGIMQVKLGTVYYTRSKRPDLIKLYVPEVNKLPKEDILHKLRVDPYFNAKIAALTHIMLTGVCGDADKASVAYNRGVCKADKQGQAYLDKLLKKERMFTVKER